MLKIKKLISLMLCIAVVSVGTMAFAEELNTGETNSQTTVTEGNKTSQAPADDKALTTPSDDSKNKETEVVPEQTPANGDAETQQPGEPEKTPEQESQSEPEKTPEPTPAPTESYEIVDSEASVVVNGTPVTFDVSLKKIVNANGDINFVPIRKVAEMLNCTVAWRGSDQTIHIFQNGKSVMFKVNSHDVVVHNFEIGSKFVYTDDEKIEKVEGAYPVVFNDRTLIPLRAVSEILGAKVNYDAEQKLITIDATEEMKKATATIADIKARNYIETYNYVPTIQLKTGTVNVKVAGNFEGAVPTLGDGVIVSIDGKTQTAANGGACVFTEMKTGTYTVTATNVPEGYKAVETTVTIKAGEDTAVSVLLEKASEADKDSTKPDNKNTDDKKDTTETKDDGSKASTDNNQSKEDTTTKTGDTSADKK